EVLGEKLELVAAFISAAVQQAEELRRVHATLAERTAPGQRRRVPWLRDAGELDQPEPRYVPLDHGLEAWVPPGMEHVEHEAEPFMSRAQGFCLVQRVERGLAWDADGMHGLDAEAHVPRTRCRQEAGQSLARQATRPFDLAGALRSDVAEATGDR